MNGITNSIKASDQKPKEIIQKNVEVLLPGVILIQRQPKYFLDKEEILANEAHVKSGNGEDYPEIHTEFQIVISHKGESLVIKDREVSDLENQSDVQHNYSILFNGATLDLHWFAIHEIFNHYTDLRGIQSKIRYNEANNYSNSSSNESVKKAKSPQEMLLFIKKLLLDKSDFTTSDIIGSVGNFLNEPSTINKDYKLKIKEQPQTTYFSDGINEYRMVASNGSIRAFVRPVLDETKFSSLKLVEDIEPKWDQASLIQVMNILKTQIENGQSWGKMQLTNPELYNQIRTSSLMDFVSGMKELKSGFTVLEVALDSSVALLEYPMGDNYSVASKTSVIGPEDGIEKLEHARNLIRYVTEKPESSGTEIERFACKYRGVGDDNTFIVTLLENGKYLLEHYIKHIDQEYYYNFSYKDPYEPMDSLKDCQYLLSLISNDIVKGNPFGRSDEEI
jgi:hypothetical protein